MNRREFMKQAGALGAAASLAAQLAGRVPLGEARAAEPAAKPMPMIRLGSIEVSRLILGSNPYGGWAHRPGDVGKEMIAWYTDERIVAELDEAAAQGITAVSIPPSDRWLRLWKEYKAGGGKMAFWIAQPAFSPQEMPRQIELSVQGGAKAVYIQGHCVEQQFEANTFDVVKGWLELIVKLGAAAGIGAHRPDVHLEAQKRKFPADFYFQCLYNVAHGDSFVKGDPPKAVEIIRQLEKPVIAYKILAASRVPPKEGFEFALKNIRPTDGVCVGVWGKEGLGQVKEDADLMKSLGA
jgi:hypothetical protein